MNWAQLEKRSQKPRITTAICGGRKSTFLAENAIKYGAKSAGNEPGTIVHIFENVRVVTNQAANRVITVITTGR